MDHRGLSCRRDGSLQRPVVEGQSLPDPAATKRPQDDAAPILHYSPRETGEDNYNVDTTCRREETGTAEAPPFEGGIIKAVEEECRA